MGAIKNVTSLASGLMSTAISTFGQDSADKKYYKKMSDAAYLQAAQTEQNAARQGKYMFKEAGQQNVELGRNYSTLLGQQKTALAASGLGRNSATAQTILKNSRLNAIMDQETLQYNIDTALYENNTASALEALNLRLQARQYSQARDNRTSSFSRGVSGAISWLNPKKGK